VPSIPGRRSAPTSESRDAIVRIHEDPVFELLPLKSAADQIAFLPPGALVSVTSSPAKGLMATVEFAEALAEQGFRVVPHIAARMVRDRAQLAEIKSRLAAAGIDRLFVPGGDATEPGEFADGLALLRALADAGHLFREIGVPCYPEGHASIPDEALLASLRAKAEIATYMTSQLCYNPEAIGTWLGARRAEGIVLPLNIGLPGVAPLAKLIQISARIGVSDSRRFLAKNTGLVARVLRPGGFKPDGLLDGIGPIAADPVAGVRTIHLYTFNQVASTEAWRRRYLERLGASVSTADQGTTTAA
jgi:methylenetetrahydrofolate reductase (NADPH)